MESKITHYINEERHRFVNTLITGMKIFYIVQTNKLARLVDLLRTASRSPLLNAAGPFFPLHQYLHCACVLSKPNFDRHIVSFTNNALTRQI